MASSPSSRIHFYDEAGKKLSGPVEGHECGIVIDAPSELHSSAKLTLGSEPISVHLEEENALMYAVWPPSKAGTYTLSLTCGNIREHKQVTVVPEHFSENDITILMNELTNLLPNSIAAHLTKCGAQLSAEPFREENATIQDDWQKLQLAIVGTKEKPGMLQILPVLQRECNQILSPKLEVKTVDKMRRPEISRIPQAISMPGNLLPSGNLYQMFDVTVQQSFETYENQLVKTYVQALRSQLSRLQARAKREQAPPAMAAEIDALASEFNLACVRASFIRDIRRSSVSADRITMVLLKNPAYRAVLEGFLALKQQSTVTLEEQGLSSPLNNVPRLYKLWINLSVMNALVQACAEFGYHCMSHHWVKSFRKGSFIQVTNDGTAAVHLVHPVSGKQVSLIPWKTGLENQNSNDDGESMSLAIAIEAPSKPLAIMLFNPKYATGPNGPRQGDIDELLRSVEMLREPAGEQDLRYAAIFYPGKSVPIATAIEAVPAVPSQGETLQKRIWHMLKPYLS